MPAFVPFLLALFASCRCVNSSDEIAGSFLALFASCRCVFPSDAMIDCTYFVRRLSWLPTFSNFNISKQQKGSNTVIFFSFAFASAIREHDK